MCPSVPTDSCPPSAHTHTLMHVLAAFARTPTQHVSCDQAAVIQPVGFCTCTLVHASWWIIGGNRQVRWRATLQLSLLSPGSGHLHGEAGGPVLHLGLLPADPAQRLRPRPGDLLQHWVHQVSQEDGLLHGWETSLRFPVVSSRLHPSRNPTAVT